MWGEGVGRVLFTWFFLIPFILIGLGTIAGVLTVLFGRVEVSIRHNAGHAMTGFGMFKWKRCFDAADVIRVRIGETTWPQNDQTKPVIVIEFRSGKRLRVGSILTDERRTWMAAALRPLLIVDGAWGSITSRIRDVRVAARAKYDR
jgi:hypothetical protein